MTRGVDIKKLEENVKAIRNPDTPIDDLKKITCTFYRGGGCPTCSGCMQDDEQIRKCSTSYAGLILEKPQEYWNNDFDRISERKSGTVPFTNVKGIGLACNSCYLSERCPLYKEASTCGIKWDVDDKQIIQPKEGIDYLISMQLKRINRAMAIEEYDGGVPDQNLSSEMDRLVSLYQARADLDTVRIKATLEASGPSNGKKGPSILERFFGNNANNGLGHEEQRQLTEGGSNTVPTIDITEAQVETVMKPIKESKNDKKGPTKKK